ncbi:MAG: hypothetical protein ACYTGP_06695 [Planctomycetota bacterium]
MTTPRTSTERLAARPARWGIAGVLVLGLLFWARLIVVSDMPRTAIADEDAHDATAPITAASNGAESDEVESATDTEQGETPAPSGHSDVHEPFATQSAHPADFPSEAQKSRPHRTEDHD